MSDAGKLVADEAHLRPLVEGVHAFIGTRGDSNAGAIETPDRCCRSAPRVRSAKSPFVSLCLDGEKSSV